ncbi:MAG: hypothetical protein N2512_07470 [Armatimonadetes bacterium]|nr:hypothetical protein [Armatimonadota bacterium]
MATGHLALGKLLRSPDVDFLVFQGQVTCVGWLAPFASARFHHKPWLLQITSTEDNPQEEPYDKIALAFAAGAHGVIAPAGSSQMAAVWKAIQEGGMAPAGAPQVAAIVDPTSAAHLSPASGLAATVLAEQMRQLEASGLRYEVWELADVTEGTTPSAPLLLFVNTYVLGEKERQLLATLRARGRVLVFSYAAGAMRPLSGVNGRDVFSLTGIAVTTLAGNGPLRVAPTPGIEPFTLYVAPGTEYGTQQKVTPWFCCVDARAEVLGRLVGTKAAGLAALRGPGWTTVYSAAPALPAALLRSLAHAAEAKTGQ